ncbi:hypothetical protein ANCDUO_17316, partial [Ancylostoma duodenale]
MTLIFLSIPYITILCRQKRLWLTSCQRHPACSQDNYCFVVDGERVRMGDILGDDQWWRHTSRPTKYFYSEDLRQFHRVNCIAVKGKVITAKLACSSLQ